MSVIFRYLPFKASKTSPDEECCIVCLDDIKNGEGVLEHKVDKTGKVVFHRFHQNCLDSWLSINNNCPLCRCEAIVVGESLVLLSEKERGSKVRQVAEVGDLKLLKQLLASGTIHVLDRGWAVQNAAQGGHLECVKVLLASGIVWYDFRGLAVEYAAQGGHLECVKALLANGFISQNARIMALEIAAKNGHQACHHFLTQSMSLYDRYCIDNSFSYRIHVVVRAVGSLRELFISSC
ncbi:MAG TPA: ankyrin repeat domain-containing protein [Chlamydiales bacterium]|nr:ankyrin repeat domain-containing protein [Chlamydiales bacterium]